MVSDLHKAELQGRKIQLGRQPQGVLGVAVPRGSTSRRGCVVDALVAHQEPVSMEFFRQEYWSG